MRLKPYSIGRGDRINRHFMKSENLTGRISELDGMRALSISLVVLFHYFYFFVPKPLNWPWNYLLFPFDSGWSRLSFMFVLSGFLIGSVLLKNRQASNYFQTFFIRRLFRILPLYYFLIIIYYVLVGLGGQSWSPWLFGQPLPAWSYFTFTQQFVAIFTGQTQLAYWFGTTWTIVVEQQFYLLLALLIRFVPSQKLTVLALMIIVVSIVFRICVFMIIPNYGSIINYTSLPARLDTLMIGVIVAIMFGSESWRERLFKGRWPLTALLVVLVAGHLALMRFTSGISSFVWQSIGYTWIGLMYAVGMAWVLTAPVQLFRRLLQHPLLTGLGTIAYGIYLIHFPMLGLAHALVFHSMPRVSTVAEVGVTLGALAVTIVLAALSWKFFEKPLVNLGRRFKYEPSAPKQEKSSSPLETT
jgi:peptidoglycan/LPS O-acetylase OafA/YrhL